MNQLCLRLVQRIYLFLWPNLHSTVDGIPAALTGKPLPTWTQVDVESWVNNGKFAPLAPFIRSHHVDGPKLSKLDDSQLRDMKIPVR